jgi:hypothetical protein
MSASITPRTSGSQCEPLLLIYRRLRRLGFDDAAAAHLVALKGGFRLGTGPWKVGQLAHLLFLRELASANGEWTGAEDRASTRIGDGWRVPPQTPRNRDQSDGRITLLSLFQAVAGSATTLDRLAPMAPGPRGVLEPRREGG